MSDRPKAGDRVCIVSMDGCMADTRGKERWGRIVRVENRVVYGSHLATPYADIAYDDGSAGQHWAGDMFRQSAGHFEAQI